MRRHMCTIYLPLLLLRLGPELRMQREMKVIVHVLAGQVPRWKLQNPKETNCMQHIESDRFP